MDTVKRNITYFKTLPYVRDVLESKELTPNISIDIYTLSLNKIELSCSRLQSEAVITEL